MALAALPACRNDTPRPPAEGDRFPEIALPDLDGRSSPWSVYAGAALVVNFWATWCDPCRREMPSLQQLSTRFRAEDLRVIGITVDDDLNLVKEFLLRYHITFPLLADHGQALARTALHIPAIPMTYLLTRERTIARIVAGGRDWADAAALGEIEAALRVRALRAG